MTVSGRAFFSAEIATDGTGTAVGHRNSHIPGLADMIVDIDDVVVVKCGLRMSGIAGEAKLLVDVGRIATDMNQMRTGQGGCGPGDAVAAITTEGLSPCDRIRNPGPYILTVTVAVESIAAGTVPVCSYIVIIPVAENSDIAAAVDMQILFIGWDHAVVGIHCSVMAGLAGLDRHDRGGAGVRIMGTGIHSRGGRRIVCVAASAVGW